MDQHLAWRQLSIPQQLNCICKTLAKRAVMTAITQGYHNMPTQILPREDVALIVWGNKVTGDDASVPLPFHASKTVARKYLHQRKCNKWMAKQFEEVEWEHLDLALKNKVDNYKI
jgi:hypothetical protein